MGVFNRSVKVSNTRILTSINSNNDVVLIYENDVVNIDEELNFLIFAIPANLSNIKLLPLESSTPFLNELGTIFTSQNRSQRDINSESLYKVLLARKASDIPNLMPDYQKANLPLLEFCDQYYSHIFSEYYEYTEWTYLAQFFNTTSELKRNRFGITYPLPNSQQIFIPGLESLNGQTPNTTAKVERDHTLVFLLPEMRGSATKIDALKVPIPDELKSQLGHSGVSSYRHGQFNNGDWMIHINDLKNGNLNSELFLINDL